MTSVSESKVERQERIQPPQTNNYGNAHGGELVKIMDEVAAISAMKVASNRCVTARISEVEFHNPVREGDVVNFEAFVYKTGRTSLEVYVRVHSERPMDDSDDNVEQTTSALFTMVAIDENGNPVETEDVTIETEGCNEMCDLIPTELKN